MNSNQQVARRGYRRLAAAVSAAVGCFALGTAPAEAELVIDLRAVTLNDQPLPASGTPHRVLVETGDQVGFQVVARVSGTNGLDDEGFTFITGVFRSSTGGLLGDLTTATVAPFNEVSSQPGAQIDADLDGDFDIGPAPNGGFPSSAFFVPRPNDVQRDGTRVDADTEEWVIGTGTWTSKDGAPAGAETFIDFIRRRHPGNPGSNATAYAQWFEDGSGTSSVHNGAAPYTTDGLWIIAVPEPAGAALTTIAALGLLSRRRR